MSSQRVVVGVTVNPNLNNTPTRTHDILHTVVADGEGFSTVIVGRSVLSVVQRSITVYGSPKHFLLSGDRLLMTRCLISGSVPTSNKPVPRRGPSRDNQYGRDRFTSGVVARGFTTWVVWEGKRTGGQ